MKFTLRATSRARKRRDSWKTRGVFELLETRKLMAGDLNMGSYVIGGGEPVIDAPSVIESIEGSAPVKETVSLEKPAPVEKSATIEETRSAEETRFSEETGPLEEAVPVESSAEASNVRDPGGVDAALTGDQSWLPPNFLPCCPAVKFDDATSEVTFLDGEGADGSLADPVRSATTFQVNGNPTGSGSRSRIASSLRTASEHRGASPLGSAASQADDLLGIADRNDAAFPDQTATEEFHYFASEGNRDLREGPSLVKQSLLGHVESDTFMAMSLLPSSTSSESVDDPTSAHESAAAPPYRSHSAQSDEIHDELDMNSLREAASAAESAQIVAPLPFLASTTESLSAAVASVVSIDCWPGGTGTLTDDACFIAKLNENRFQFAAFAFVFTVVTVRMNSRESEQQDVELETSQESPQVPS